MYNFKFHIRLNTSAWNAELYPGATGGFLTVITLAAGYGGPICILELIFPGLVGLLAPPYITSTIQALLASNHIKAHDIHVCDLFLQFQMRNT